MKVNGNKLPFKSPVNEKPHVLWINKAILAVVISLTMLTVASVLGSRYIGAAFVVLLIGVLTHTRRYILEQVISYRYLLLFFVPFVGTVNHALSFNEYPDVWQISRTQIWTLLIPLFTHATYQYTINAPIVFLEKTKFFIKIFLIGASLLVLLEYFSGLELSPAYIRPSYQDSIEHDGRIYVFGLQLVAPFLPIFFVQKNWIAVVACVLILAFTGGKMAVAPIIALIVFIITQNKSTISNRKLLITLSVIASIVIFFAIGDRLILLTEIGDQRRLTQVLDVINTVTRDIITMLFGNGFGTKFSEGYFIIFNPYRDEITPLLINSQYDVENGYGHLVLRFGLIGTVLFFNLILSRLGKLKLYFVTYWGIAFIGYAPVGPISALEFSAFAFSSAYFQRCYTVKHILK